MRSFVLAAGAMALCSAAHAADLYGVASYSQFGTQSLYRIDPITGAASLVGNTGIRQINGLAFDSSTATMYALTTDSKLYRINLLNGASNLIASRADTLPEGDIAFGPDGDFIATRGFELGSLNRSTAGFSPIGGMGAAANDVSGLAFDGSGALFGYAKNGTLEDTLLSINPDTGSASVIGPTGISTAPAVGGLAFDSDLSTLFLSDGASLYSVNRDTGAASLIGAHGVSGFSGLAVPAPGAAAGLLGLALAAARRRR